MREDARRAVTAYASVHPKDLFGAHHYDLAQYGLHADELMERFAWYVDRYGVNVEPVAR